MALAYFAFSRPAKLRAFLIMWQRSCSARGLLVMSIKSREPSV